MAKFTIQDRATATAIDEFYSYQEAVEQLIEQENADKKQNQYSKDYYEIIAEDPDQYSYTDIIECVRDYPNAKNINTLGLWFYHYGNEYWNGEFYHCSELNADIYPFTGSFGFYMN